jgi:hypothetical protein
MNIIKDLLYSIDPAKSIHDFRETLENNFSDENQEKPEMVTASSADKDSFVTQAAGKEIGLEPDDVNRLSTQSKQNIVNKVAAPRKL